MDMQQCGQRGVVNEELQRERGGGLKAGDREVDAIGVEQGGVERIGVEWSGLGVRGRGCGRMCEHPPT